MQRAFRKNIRIGSGILLAIAMAGCGKDNPAKNNGTGQIGRAHV